MDEIDRLFMKSTLLHTKWCEVWLPVRDHATYEVSSRGRVRNSLTSRILRLGTDEHGYSTVSLYTHSSETKSKVHRLVAIAFYENPENKPMVDHMDNNKLNNDISNLRWVTPSQNRMNVSQFTNNTSGCTGVYWLKARQKWIAFIRVDSIRKHLGCYNSVEAATRARKRAVYKMFGEFACKA